MGYVRTHTDELYRADGREIRLEESTWLGAGLLIPSDGFSAEVSLVNYRPVSMLPVFSKMFEKVMLD